MKDTKGSIATFALFAISILLPVSLIIYLASTPEYQQKKQQEEYEEETRSRIKEACYQIAEQGLNENQLNVPNICLPYLEE